MTNYNDEQLQKIRNLSDIQQQLFDRQVEYLKDEGKKYIDTIKEFTGYEYKFTHPTIKWKSKLGPVMSLQEDFLYVYTSEDKVVKFDLLNDHYEHPSNFEEIVRLGGFEEAVAGFKTIESLLQSYLDELHVSIHDLEQQLKAFE
jgi:predicted RNA-binding protein